MKHITVDLEEYIRNEMEDSKQRAFCRNVKELNEIEAQWATRAIAMEDVLTHANCTVDKPIRAKIINDVVDCKSEDTKLGKETDLHNRH